MHSRISRGAQPIRSESATPAQPLIESGLRSRCLGSIHPSKTARSLWKDPAARQAHCRISVPARWKDSDVLALLRAHVRDKSVDGGDGKGMAFMPALEE